MANYFPYVDKKETILATMSFEFALDTLRKDKQNILKNNSEGMFAFLLQGRIFSQFHRKKFGSGPKFIHTLTTGKTVLFFSLYFFFP